MLWLVVILLLLPVACRFQPGEREFREVENTIPATLEAKLEKFSDYDVERQIDMYIFSQNQVHGFTDQDLRFLADHGDTKKDAIARRIDSIDRSKFKADLIRVLDTVDQSCRCVRKDGVVMELLGRNEMAIEKADPEDVRVSKELYAKVLSQIRSRESEKD
jgi:hypothetical protein